MTQPREQDRPRPLKPTRARPRIVIHAGDLDEPARSGTQDGIAEVTISRTRFERIGGKRRPIGKLLEDYADTLARAERERRIATMTFEVSPDGEARLVGIGAEGDALDAALNAAKVRGQAKVTDILRSEGMLNAREFGQLIGASHETVNARRKTGEILGLEGATRGVRYPRWQVTDAGLPLPGLADLSKSLGGQPWTVYRFLCSAHAELGGRTGLGALKAGQFEAVLDAARNQTTGAFG